MILEISFLISMIFALFIATSIGTMFGVTQTVIVSMTPFCIYLSISAFIEKINWNNRNNLLSYSIILVGIFGIVFKTLAEQDYSKELLCLLILPMLLSLTLDNINRSEKIILKYSVLLFLFVECTLAIVEKVMQINFFIDEDSLLSLLENDWEFRSTSLLGHPLMNAMIVAIINIFIVVSNEISIKTKMFFTTLSLLAILAFNARGAFMVFSFITLPLFFKKIWYSYGTKSTLSFIIIFLSVFLVFILYTDYNWGGRLFKAEELIDGSAQTRLDVFDFYKYLSWDELLIGNHENYAKVMKAVHAAGVENGEIALIINYGGILTLIFLPMLVIFHWTRLSSHYCKIDTWAIMITFYLIGSFNPNITQSLPWTYWILAYYAFRPIEEDSETEEEQESNDYVTLDIDI